MKIFRNPVDAGVRRHIADWHFDHDKRLEDALIAQNGADCGDGTHDDGVHRRDGNPWPGKKKGRVNGQQLRAP